jgi:hypothetical protein
MQHRASAALRGGEDRSPAVLGPQEIRANLVYLTTEKQPTPSSVGIAVL